MPGILRFVSMLFLTFEKGMSNKSCARSFKIRKYAFFNVLKKYGQRNCAKNLKIPQYAFLIFEKGMSKKIAPGMLIFVSMLCFKI